MSELSEAISEMRNMRESYDQLAATADLYQQGRTALASAITAKGVPTTPTTPLADMAENVGDIQQVTTTIDGGDMYAAQLFGDGVLWNLYEVLAQMKSQYMGAGHYAALIVCEYYKGYDSLQLQGADAYYTCDGDFYDYDALHTWHDSENGKSNRWVCFLYQQEGARLDITNTAISPRSMYIGGHIGTIEYFVNGRLTELVCGVEETDVVDVFQLGAKTQSWNRNLIIRGVKSFGNGVDTTITVAGGIVVLDIESASVINGLSIDGADVVNIPKLQTITCSNRAFVIGNGVGQFRVDGLKTIINSNNLALLTIGSGLQVLYMPDFYYYYAPAERTLFTGGTNIVDFVIGEFSRNLKTGWNPTSVLSNTTKKSQLIENIKNHILARVSDRTGLSQLVFTISTNMYNNIASETITWNDEEMTLADAFLTKNWLLAGA